MVHSIVARRSLVELARLRGLLDGSLSPEEVGADGKATDGGNRRAAALAIVDRLGGMFGAVLETAALAEETAFRAAGGRELLEGQGAGRPEEPRRPFGFAAGRKDAA